MDQIRDASEQAPGLLAELPRKSVGEGASRVHPSLQNFSHEEHQALHQMTRCDLILRPIGWETLAGTYVRREVIATLTGMGLCRTERSDLAQERFIITAQITPRGIMIAQLMGAPGLFPLRGLTGGTI